MHSAKRTTIGPRSWGDSPSRQLLDRLKGLWQAASPAVRLAFIDWLNAGGAANGHGATSAGPGEEHKK